MNIEPTSMPLPSPPYSPEVQNHEDDGVTTDSDGDLAMAIITPDGKCPEHPSVTLRGRDVHGQMVQLDSCPICDDELERKKEAIRRQQCELEREMASLDRSSPREGNSGNSSINSRSAATDPSQQQSHPYRPPVSVDYFQGGGSAGLPYPQQYPTPGGGGNNIVADGYTRMNGVGGPPLYNVASFPFYPPNFAFMPPHHHVMSGATAPRMEVAFGSGDENNSHLWKRLEEKDELKETELKLQEQIWMSARLQAALHQAERQLVQLQAEKKAQERLYVQQQEIIKMQQHLMEKWQNPTMAPSILTKHEERLPEEVVHPSPIGKNQRTVDVAVHATGTEFTPTKAKLATTATTHIRSPNKHPWDNAEAAAATTKLQFQELMNNKSLNMDCEGGNDFDGSKNEDESKVPSVLPSIPAVNQSNGKHCIGSSQNIHETVNTSASAVPKTTAFLPAMRTTPVFVIKTSQQQQHSANDNDDDDSIGDVTVNPLDDSSTYGEDFIDVVNQPLPDTIGIHSVYTGVVLRSTGLPHGKGRMICKDGLSYEGEW